MKQRKMNQCGASAGMERRFSDLSFRRGGSLCICMSVGRYIRIGVGRFSGWR